MRALACLQMASPRPLAPLAVLAVLIAASGCGTSNAPGTRAAAPARSTTAEPRDPQEASSYPVPAGTKHASAAAPETLEVAYGAASNEEVEHELAAVKSSEHRAHTTTLADLKPVPGGESIGGDGTLPIPANVPAAVQRAIAGANEIADFPYVYGGGHASFIDSAYDCSGSVSYVLAAAGLLSRPEDSTELESWGAKGPGRYMTIYTNAGHAYMYIDGVLYDTAGRSGPYTSRWQVGAADNEGFAARHWPGL